MKKTMSIIALFIVLIVSVSAGTTIETIHPNPQNLPDLQLSRFDSRRMELDSLPATFTVVHLWSAQDAPSRIEAIELDRFVASHAGQLNLLSINTDDNHKLFREIVRMDGLDEATQFYADSALVTMRMRAQGFNQGSHTFLLAPDGTIVAINPSVEILSRAIEL